MTVPAETGGDRIFAAVRLPPGFKPRTVHAWGWPDELAPRQPNLKVLMPLPRVLVLRRVAHGYLMERFAEDGTFAGDTWHQDRSAGLKEAEEEYGPYIGHWEQIPGDVDDHASYALERSRQPPRA